jgi:hypothetical protein
MTLSPAPSVQKDMWSTPPAILGDWFSKIVDRRRLGMWGVVVSYPAKTLSPLNVSTKTANT